MVIGNKVYSLLFVVVLLVVLFFFSVESVQAQNVTRFTPQVVFELPAVDGVISFSVNGTYTAAVLENDMWVFSNLSLGGSRFSGNLRFSAVNCSVVIHSFQLNSLSYTVDGVGEQVVHLGFNSSRSLHVSEWSVINQDRVFFAAGRDWELLPDNSVVVHGLLGTLTVRYYNYGYPVGVDDRPFYLQHSILILTGVAVVVTVVVALVIKLKPVQKRRRLF